MTLNLRVSLSTDVEGPLGTTLAKHFERCHLVSAGTARKGSELDLIYTARLQSSASPTEVIRELKRLAGVESVDLQQHK